MSHGDDPLRRSCFGSLAFPVRISWNVVSCLTAETLSHGVPETSRVRRVTLGRDARGSSFSLVGIPSKWSRGRDERQSYRERVRERESEGEKAQSREGRTVNSQRWRCSEALVVKSDICSRYITNNLSNRLDWSLLNSHPSISLLDSSCTFGLFPLHVFVFRFPRREFSDTDSKESFPFFPASPRRCFDIVHPVRLHYSSKSLAFRKCSNQLEN